MKTRYVLTITAIFLAIMFVVGGCGGGDSSGDNSIPPASNTPTDGDNGEYISITEELSGTISVNSETGVSIYESEEIEIKPGLLFKRSAVLTPKDPQNDQLGYSAMSILKFTSTTDSEETTKFIEEIPKSFATHVDQLEYKALINESPNLTITDLLNDSSSFDSIDDLVNKGYVEVLEEDPVLELIIGGAALISSFYVIFEQPEIVGLTPHSTADEVAYLKNNKYDEFKEWMEDRLLTKYCSAIRHSAETNNIPAQLLANIVLNEMADYEWKDTIQEVVYTGETRSHGWPQLQPKRIIDHRLIDIGTVNEVRDPTVDIVENDRKQEIPGQPGESPLVLITPINEMIWKRLITPEPSIELAAREIAHLLDMFKKGSAVLNNPWAKALLINPAEGINRNKIYENLKYLPTRTDDPDELQIAQDRTLALLIAAGYNGSGTIFDLKDEDKVFTATELSYINESGYDGLIENRIPWEMADDMYAKKSETDTYKYSFASPRIHGWNAGRIFPKVLHESECLKTTENLIQAKYCSMKGEGGSRVYAAINGVNTAPDGTYAWCWYWDNSQLQQESPVIDGEKEGIVMGFHQNGNLASEVSWTDSQLNGEYKVYDTDGNLTNCWLYENGIEKGSCM